VNAPVGPSAAAKSAAGVASAKAPVGASATANALVATPEDGVIAPNPPVTIAAAGRWPG
jgi:hypothetical protein